MFWKKNPTIEFVSLVPGLSDLMPLTKASRKDFKWLENAYKDFSDKKSDFNNSPIQQKHIVRCPGIFNLFKVGWVQRAWQDITITTNGDGVNFHWNTPLDQKRIAPHVPGVVEYVGAHEELIQRYSNDFRSLRNIVKIQSPWIAYIPKGYSLLNTPVPYPDNKDWEAQFGIQECIPGAPLPLSVHLNWFVKEGTTVIKAGTPLHQLFLIKNEEVDTIIRDVEDRDKDNMSKTLVAGHNTNVAKFQQLKNIKWS